MSPSSDSILFKSILGNFRFDSIALLMVVLLLGATSCSKDGINQKTVPLSLLDTEIATDVRITYSDSAKVKVIINSPLLHRHTALRRVKNEFPEGVEVNFLDDFQRTQSTLTANYAIHVSAEEKIYIRDNVVWESIDGNRLETEELIWDQRSKKIRSQKTVLIYTPEDNYMGVGFEADQDFKNWKIIKPIGNLSVKDLKNSKLKN